MLPCRRRVHLHKSASFDFVFVKIQTNQKHGAIIDPKPIEKSIYENHPNNDSEINRQISPKIPFQILGPIREPDAGHVRGPARFVRYLFVRTSGGTPSDRC